MLLIQRTTVIPYSCCSCKNLNQDILLQSKMRPQLDDRNSNLGCCTLASTQVFLQYIYGIRFLCDRYLFRELTLFEDLRHH